MPNEIYHRSEWGNPAEQWGNVYLNADLTNELYKRASEYENSWVTDQLLNGVGTKPSIILTPTAYEDGKLNSVKPQRTLGSELVTNGNFATDSDWSKGTGWSIANNRATSDASANSYLNQQVYEIGKKYKLNFEVLEGTIELRSVQYSKGTGFYTTGTYSVEVIPTTTSTHFYVYTGFGQSSIDNVSVKEITGADFDFARGSSATRVNEKGLVQDVQLLSGELVQNGNFEQIGSELVTNGDFSDGTNSWITNGDSFTIVDGALRINRVTNTTFIQQNVLTSGRKYKVEFDVLDKADNNGTFIVRLGSNNVYDVVTYEGTRFSKILTSSGTDFRIYSSSDNGVVYIDNVSVKEVGQNWNISSGASIGENKLNVDAIAFDFFATQYALTNGLNYKVTLDAEVTSGDILLYTGTQFGTINSNGSYTFYIISNSSQIRFRSGGSGAVGSITNISVIEITDDTDLPRINYTNFDYENGEVVPYSGEGSLLLEPQSTNLITYSEDFNQWTATGNTTISATNITSPSGKNNATNITGLNGSGSNDLRFFPSGFNSANKTLSFSLYLKGSGTLSLQMSNGVDQAPRETITLTSNWKRHILTTTFNSTTSISFHVNIDDFNSATATSYDIWGAQLEEGSYPTSYIPTEGSTVTRLADVCNNSGSSDLINSTEGVLYAEISLNLLTPNMYIQISDGTYSNRVAIINNNSSNSWRVFYRVNGSSQIDATASGLNTFETNKIAISWKLNEFKFYVNGIKITQVNSGSVNPTNTFNRLEFKDIISNNFYGNVKCLAVFKEALSDTELQKLTS